ncbi:MAG: hypothetical protein ACD_10C00481G0003, partial [uncultured bacterium]
MRVGFFQRVSCPGGANLRDAVIQQMRNFMGGHFDVGSTLDAHGFLAA